MLAKQLLPMLALLDDYQAGAFEYEVVVGNGPGCRLVRGTADVPGLVRGEADVCGLRRGVADVPGLVRGKAAI